MKSKCILVLMAVLSALMPSAWAAAKFKILHSFTGGTDGNGPNGPLLADHNGNLYGITIAGGGSGCGGAGCGTVFEVTPAGNGRWTEQILYAFTGTGDSGAPQGNLVQDAAGNLYGFTKGDYCCYTAVFELSPGSGGWNLSQIWTQSASPGLLLDAAGDLYGEIGQGEYKAGAIGELSPGYNGWAYADLYDFCRYSHSGISQPSPLTCPDGWGIQSPLTWDTIGNLYGTMFFGGNYQYCGGSAGCGVAFRMTPNGDGTWTYHVLHRFAQSNSDGSYPYAGLVVDASGNAYGATWAGGKYGNGTFYKLTPTKHGLWKETILYEFPNCKNGCGPNESLVFDKAGNLYGAAAGGNMTCSGYSCGVIYKFTPQKNGKWKYIVLHKFNWTDGSGPLGVTLDGKGNIFGTTFGGGKYGWDTAFEITP